MGEPQRLADRANRQMRLTVASTMKFREIISQTQRNSEKINAVAVDKKRNPLQGFRLKVQPQQLYACGCTVSFLVRGHQALDFGDFRSDQGWITSALDIQTQ
jgi:hypothetical protein